MFLKWSVSETPYLIHDTTKAPHITGSGVLLVVDGQMRGTHTKHDHSCHVRAILNILHAVREQIF